jgi:GNAT superfamily N-acetyltransferase
MVDIRELRREEIPFLKEFTPPEWNTDLSSVFSLHFGQPYFHPVAAISHGAVVGCGNSLLQGNAAWLGNIIVLPEYRGRGIGRALTKHLMDACQSIGIRHQILIATKMGEPVYTRLGFEIATYYRFFKREKLFPSHGSSSIRRLEPEDAPDIYDLDRFVTAEERELFLGRFLEGGHVHLSPSGRIDGFLLPGLGNSLVIADDDEAGLSLLRQRLDLGGQATVVPEQNEAAIGWLLSEGFAETQRAPRMVFGGDVSWHPERVYSRASGYCG